MMNFTPWPALLGGLLIGVSATIVLVFHGKVAGISGIWGGLLRRPVLDAGFRYSFAAGLLAAGLLFAFLQPQAMQGSPMSLPWVAVAGLLVGFGTRLGGGCTSGHGVCGNSRFAPRSMVATASFIASGMLTVALVRVVQGWL